MKRVQKVRARAMWILFRSKGFGQAMERRRTSKLVIRQTSIDLGGTADELEQECDQLAMDVISWIPT